MQKYTYGYIYIYTYGCTYRGKYISCVDIYNNNTHHRHSYDRGWCDLMVWFGHENIAVDSTEGTLRTGQWCLSREYPLPSDGVSTPWTYKKINSRLDIFKPVRCLGITHQQKQGNWFSRRWTDQAADRAGLHGISSTWNKIIKYL